MRTSRSLYLLVALLFTTGVQSATFVGCSTVSPNDPVVTVTSTPYEKCNAACAGFAYSFTEVPANDGDTVSCSCANTLSSSSSEYDTSVGKMCTAGNFAIQDLDTLYASDACYQKTAGIDANWVSLQPDQCYDHCKQSGNSYTFTSQTETGAWQCGCAGSLPTSTESTTCGGHDTYTSYYYYVREPKPSQDAQHKRKLKERMASRRRALVEELCPNRMVACRVEGVDAYECLDVSAELESCGGCMFGVYTTARTPPSRNAIVGTDCSALPGIPMGAVTCMSGQCTASVCKKGWNLGEGKCIKAGKKTRGAK